MNSLILRHREFQFVIEWINLQKSGYIFSLPKVGVTSFLKSIQQETAFLENHILQKDLRLLPVYIDFASLPNDETITLYKILVANLLNIAHERQVLDEHHHLSINPLEILNSNPDIVYLHMIINELSEYFAKNNVQVLWMFDSFCNYFEYINYQTLQFILSLDEFVPHLLLLAMGNEKNILEQIPLNKKIMSKFWLRAMSLGDTYKFIQHLANQLSIELNEVERAQIIELSGQQPYLIKILLYKLKDDGLSSLMSNKWIKEGLKDINISNYLQSLWDSLTRRQAIELKNYLEHEKEPKLDTVSALLNMGFIIEDNNSYQITTRLFESFILASKVNCEKQIIRVDNNLNFYLGDQLITLSELESRLLELFVEHPKEKLFKDFVISSVWPNSAIMNNSGITDENLHQLIRSLRIKLEVNPAKPQYIVTVRASKYGDGGYIFYPEGEPKAK